MRQLIFLFSALVISFTGTAQWLTSSPEEFSSAILSFEDQVKTASSYSFSTSYSFYENAVSSPVLSYSGSIKCEKGMEWDIVQYNSHIVQNDKLNVTCDTVEKTIMVRDFDQTLITRKTSDSYKEFMDESVKIEKSADKLNTKYKVIFPKGGIYREAQIWFNKKGQVEKYILFSSLNTIEDKVAEPRMEITYSNYKFGDDLRLNGMKRVSDYIILSENQINVNPNYKDYEITDLRTKSTTN